MGGGYFPIASVLFGSVEIPFSILYAQDKQFHLWERSTWKALASDLPVRVWRILQQGEQRILQGVQKNHNILQVDSTWATNEAGQN